jgi:hypothetical protein
MLAHSAGSVVAFDFLFYLFYVAHKVEHFIDLSLIQPPSDASVIQPEATAPVEKTMSALQKLRELAQQDKLRIRRLYTFGSPITSTIFRSDAVLKILSREAGSNLLDVSCHGLNRNPAAFGQPLTGPRWINIWDKDDPIAWPVEPLMTGAGTTVIDKYLDVSDNPMRAHTVYWDNVRVHEVIGNSW